MRQVLTIGGLACLLALAAPAVARADDLTDQLRQYFGVQGDKLKKDIDELLRSIPRFEAPTIDEDGNIIIRRKPPLPPGADPWTGEVPPQDPDFANI
ncbi:MAG TPA: hypothetical protein VMQ73_09070 [Methylomirabilota bacterium]|nr:hypothetical protein [Methylomirabilota bacterium]